MPAFKYPKEYVTLEFVGAATAAIRYYRHGFTLIDVPQTTNILIPT